MTVNTTNWTPDSTLRAHLASLHKASLSAFHADPRLIEEHANQEEQISVGGYARRVVRELVQNAADAMAGSSNATDHSSRIDVVLDTNQQVLYVANAGRPISRAGLEGLTHAHLSGKRGDEIGKFGLGFKSVLSVCSNPEIFSRTISFRFGGSRNQDQLRSISPDLSRYPTLRLATEIDAAEETEADDTLAKLMEHASTVVRLTNLSDYKSLLSEIRDFHGLFLLFVEHVRSITFTILGERNETIEHRCDRVGEGRFSITGPNGKRGEWIVASMMHKPSRGARAQAGATVTREQVKISVAIPVDKSDIPIGEFWSHFPLKDRTSASGIFNAPWSLVDDRSSMLDNQYNMEIEQQLLNLFIENLPRIFSPDDPGSILEYLPARATRQGEAASAADFRFRSKAPNLAASAALVPNAVKELHHPGDLIPLSFSDPVHWQLHREWQAAPNTEDDVPHWSCYRNDTRKTRLRDLFVARFVDLAAASSDKEADRLLRSVPQRPFTMWFREWSTGASPEMTLQILRAAVELAQKEPGYRKRLEVTAFIPTDAGLKSPSARDILFVKGNDGYTADGFIFVSDLLASQPGARALLREFGIEELDPETKIKSQLKQLSITDPVEKHRALWQSLAEDLPFSVATSLAGRYGRVLLMPTRSGDWLPSNRVLDIPDLRSLDDGKPYLLDDDVAPPQLAHAAGARHKIHTNFALADEPLALDYERSILGAMNEATEPGERGVESVVFQPEEGPGPVSILGLLAKAGAGTRTVIKWTQQLLAHPCQRDWTAYDAHVDGEPWQVDSPQFWALQRFGLVNSEWGPRNPLDTVSPKLLEFRDLLPRCAETPQSIAFLELPDSLESMEFAQLSQLFNAAMLERKEFPVLAGQRDADAVLEKFCTAVVDRYAENGLTPTYLPARRGMKIVASSVDEIYVASGAEQLTYLHKRERCYLRPVDLTPSQLAARLGVRDFSEVFSYEVVSTGRGDSELIMDRFKGLEGRQGARGLKGKYLVACEDIRKETNTPDGLTSHSLRIHHDEDVSEVLVSNHLSDEEILQHLSRLFNLELTATDVEEVLDKALSDELDLVRIEARALEHDAARLERYLGRDRLLEALPKGLWEGLRAQGAVDDKTSVGELCLMVHGSLTIKVLRDQFHAVGFKDVPTSWGRNRPTKSWLDNMGFSQHFAPENAEGLDTTLVVEGAVDLPDLHEFQRRVSSKLQDKILSPDDSGRARKVMIDMPTGVGKTRVAVQSILELFTRRELHGPVLWIAESQELCEQAVQTWRFVWRGLLDIEPLTVSRLWGSNTVTEPVTEFSVIVATDAKLHAIINDSRQADAYSWLQDAAVVVVDEAHRSGTSPMYTNILGWLGVDGRHFERPLIGLSATPFKGGDASTKQLAARYGNERIAGFASENPFSEAIAGGYLAKVNHVVLDGIDVNLDTRERENAQRGLVSKNVLDRIGKDQGRMRMVVDHIRHETPDDWPVLVFTPSVVSAQVLAATLQFYGIPSASVSGETSRSERRRVIEEFRNDKIRVLTNCDLLVQGFDAPGVRSLIIARPTFSRSAYIQMVGRGLRGPENGGKDECRIVDIQDNFGDAQELLDHLNYVDLWEKKTT